MRTSRVGVRIGAAGVVLGLGAALGLAFAAPASADTANPSTIDTTQTGSIVVHKYEMQPGGPGDAGDGTAISDTSGLGAPMANVTFTAWQVTPIDLTQNSGWVDANTLESTLATALGSATSGGVAATNNAAATAITGAGFSLSTSPVSGTTDSTGTATLASLPLGLYLVEETAAPAGTTPAVPFLVSVPMTNPDATVDPANPALSSWMYTVNVYPKNSVITAQKTVSDATVADPGAPITWTILSAIPYDTSISAYQVVDPLDPRLAYAGNLQVSIVPSTGAPIPLTAGTDYTVSTDPETTSAASSSNGYDYAADTSYTQLTVTFTPAGLAKLAANNNTGQVSISFDTTINSTVTVNGTSQPVVVNGPIPNLAWVYPNQASTAWTPSNPGEVPNTPADCSDTTPNPNSDVCPAPVPAADTTNPGTPDNPNPVVTKWGSVTLEKTDPAGNAITTGAVFKVQYSTTTDGTTWSSWTDWNDQSGTVDFTTDGQGMLTIQQLRYSDWANGQSVTDTQAGYIKYQLVEVTAPKGYELLAQPVPFTVTDTTQGVSITIKDVPSNSGFQLPLTGGSGTTAIYLGGALILLGALVITLRVRRRTGADAER